MKSIKKSTTDGIYLLLGSNLGGRLQNIQNAEAHLIKRGIIIKQSSSFFESAPWGNEDQPAFINQVLEVQTDLSPQKLLKTALDIEREMGRERDGVLWGPRTIDMDLLFYNQEIIDERGLTLPHPEIQHRRFTLEPFCEISPDFHHPVLQQSMKEILKFCKDTLPVHIVEF